ncbi:MAG: hypothetical protein A2X64_02375 [Ignavibacteria bacterium GWF2_33_9]|nr:MAG: hypothetical protein A2X64_02375 [Ignavibacteria bacterium GWF2_33_9]
MNFDINLILIIELLILGSLAAFAAGMFGVGGGIIIVPGLSFILQSMGFNFDDSMHTAIATSMVNMFFVASGSVLANKKLNLIYWRVFFQSMIPIVIGVIAGIFISTALSGKILNIIFGVFLSSVSIKIIFDSSKKNRKLHSEIKTEYNVFILIFSMLFIGVLAGLLGLGAGFAVVPFFIYYCLPIKEATGTSSAITFVVSVTGTILYLLKSNLGTIDSPYFYGYIFWFGILIMLPTSFFLSHLGAVVKNNMHDNKLTIVFALILSLVALKMIYPIIKELI